MWPIFVSTDLSCGPRGQIGRNVGLGPLVYNPGSALGNGILCFRCEGGGGVEVDPYLEWLVSDHRGFLFQNVYCAICHGVEIHRVIYWLAEISCSDEYYKYLNTSTVASYSAGQLNNRNSLQQQLISGECEIKYSWPLSQDVYGRKQDPRSPGLIPLAQGYRTCKPAEFRCPLTWPDDSAPETEMKAQCVKRLCESSNFTRYVYNIDNLIYRNEFCAECNEVPREALSCEPPPMAFSPPPQWAGPYPLSIVIDLNGGGSAHVETNVGFELSDEARQNAAQVLHCEDGSVFDPFQKQCIPLVCSDGFIFLDNECRKVTEIRSNETQDDVTDCARIRITNFLILDNGSLYVNSSGALYPEDLYWIDSQDGAALVCSDFTQNYTEASNNTQKIQLKFSTALTIISVIGQVISIIWLIVLLVIYSVFSQLRSTPGKNLMCLSGSLLLAQTLFLFAVGATGNHTFCVISAVILHYFFLAAFSWIHVMSFDVWQTFSHEKVISTNHRKRFLFFSLYGWGTPLLVIIASVVANEVLSLDSAYRPGYGEGLCWITHRTGLLVFFGVPLACIIGCNFLFYILTLRHLVLLSQTTKLLQQTTENKHRFTLYVKLSVIMGLTWVFGFVATATEVELLWYLFVLLNSLQGAFLCLSFVVTKKVWKLLSDKRRKMGRREETLESKTRSTPLSSPSLSRSHRVQLPNLHHKHGRLGSD